MEKKISLIVPVYNAQRYLPDCVRSLCEQSLKEIEILLLDDGSTDRSLELCRKYAQMDSRIRVLHQENAGLGMTRNLGLEEARGRYVGFVDADDRILPDMCEKMYLAAERTGAEMVLAGIRHVGGNLFSQKTDRTICEFEREELFCGEKGRQKLLFGIVGAEPWEAEDSRYNFSVCKNLYRRDVAERYRIRFPSEREIISEDVIFLLRFISHIHAAVGIPGAFYCYCNHDQSLTSRYRMDFTKQISVMAEAVERELAGKLPEADIRRCVDRMFQARMRVALVMETRWGWEQGRSCFQIAKRLRALSRTPRLQQVLRCYPYWRLPAKQALFAFAMRWRLSWLEYFLIWLKERR